MCQLVVCTYLPVKDLSRLVFPPMFHNKSLILNIDLNLSDVKPKVHPSIKLCHRICFFLFLILNVRINSLTYFVIHVYFNFQL